MSTVVTASNGIQLSPVTVVFTINDVTTGTTVWFGTGSSGSCTAELLANDDGSYQEQSWDCNSVESGMSLTLNSSDNFTVTASYNTAVSAPVSINL
jgi:hypothetical protein